MYQALLHKISVSGAKLLLISLSQPVPKIVKKSPWEKKLRPEDGYGDFNKNNRIDEIYKFYRDYSKEEAIELFRMPGLRRFQDTNGITLIADIASKYYNVINHYRVTTDTPETYSKTVWIFGNCCAVGAFAEDKYTVASQLQRKFNQEFPNTTRVLNAANWQKLEGTCRQILSPFYTFSKNDIIVLISGIYEENFLSALDLFKDNNSFFFKDISGCFQRPHAYGEIFFDNIHMQKGGYGIVSETLFDLIKFIQKNTDSKTVYPKEIKSYLDYLVLQKEKNTKTAKTIGAIAMNCNPFTKGHKFLVDEARKRCDFLYIFILDEDKSFFSFNDRITMAKLCLREYNDICVIPSGKMIISSQTLPEYFSKDDLQDINIDVSKDINMFCKYIAPCLQITKRFVGNEPLCNITRQYNDAMRDFLPKHGIEFVEIPRLSCNENIISASSVRKCINNNDYDTIKELVPETTLTFLKEKGIIHC